MAGTEEMTVDAPADETHPIVLDDEERDLVTAEIDALLPALGGDRLARFEHLRDAVDAGEVPGDHAGALETLLELGLQNGRARRLYSAEGERILTGLHRRTPGGVELAAHMRSVNRALGALEGATLDKVSVRMRTLGHFSVTVATDKATLTLGVRPEGVDVESVVVG